LQPSLLEEASADFEKSVALDPLQENAMLYLNISFRERSGTRSGEEEKRADLATADQWLEKSYDARSEKIQASISAAGSRSPALAGTDAILKQWASMSVGPPPPPPPVPPPSRAMVRNELSAPGWDPAPKGKEAPAPTRVPPDVQAQKLVTRIDPEIAAQSSTEPPLRFVVVIGKDGHIVSERVISGNPWLVDTAADALHRWVYRPTLVEGRPVEVVTEVRVEI
jgi:hypothetical protein